MLCILIFFRHVVLLLVKISALAYNPVESKPSHDFFSIQYPSREGKFIYLTSSKVVTRCGAVCPCLLPHLMDSSISFSSRNKYVIDSMIKLS